MKLEILSESLKDEVMKHYQAGVNDGKKAILREVRNELSRLKELVDSNLSELSSSEF